MIHFVVTLKGRTVNRFDVDLSRVRIGRLPDNEVQIDNSSVSRLHCLLDHDDEGWWVEDQGSYNGTFLNGARLQSRCRVRNGDTIGVGQFLVSLKTEVEDLVASSQFLGRNISVRASRDPTTRQAQATEKGYLVRSNSPGSPIVMTRDLTQFGSAPDAEVKVEGPHKRALIVRGYGGFQLVNVTRELVSRNGAPVLGVAWLEDHDALEIGPLKFEFNLGLPMSDDGQATIMMQIPPGGFKKPPGV
ncbi:MAG: FHA domain-containing protein [Planctomycetes bacterium]|nr:FHA domain-containing protein [Planctomycetota bacterium]